LSHEAGHFTKDNHIHNSSSISYICHSTYNKDITIGVQVKICHPIVSVLMVGPIIYLNIVQTQDYLHSINCLYVYEMCSSSYLQWWACRWRAV